MKSYTILLFIFCGVTAQAQSNAAGNRAISPVEFKSIQPNPKVTVDTISPQSAIFLDPAIQSFTACIIVNGIAAFETQHYGNVLPLPMPSGTIIIIDNIMFREKNGNIVKRPPKKFIVR